MVDNILVRNQSATSLMGFLQDNDFIVDRVTDSVIQISRFEELPIFIHTKGNSLYFEVDLGSISEMASEKLYFDLLDLNTEILPVSVGIDRADNRDPKLVLVESREIQNLDENELLSVFNALELATDKVESILSAHLK